MSSINSNHPLILQNTMTGGKERFIPHEENKVKVFTCGPSIYSLPHIGNYRSFLYEDILCRYLEYLGYRVDRLINFTDIEDKAIRAANRKNKDPRELTEKVATQFFKDCGLLHLKLPDYIPRSSNSVDQSIELIQILMEKGYAYKHKKDYFFDPLKFPGFGRLYGLDMSKWPEKKTRFRKDTYSGRRWNLGDFIIWHYYRPERDENTFWDSPLGKGRPAWNIQDPAMITKHLGYQVDICCGGVDNLYRHHDYNIAVIEAVSGKEFCHYWLHGEHVLLEGKKISKSKGNIVYPRQILDKGISSSSLRWYLLDGHYRKRLNLTDKTIKKADERCRKLQNMALRFSNPLPEDCKKSNEAGEYINALADGFEKALNDDLQVNKALTALELNLGKLNKLLDKKSLDNNQRRKVEQNLIRIDRVLQVIYL